MPRHEIKDRLVGNILFGGEYDNLSACVVAAVRSGANLYGADLARANLARANLGGADLGGADLDGANLYGANLARANLARANLDGANLDGANLYGADLGGATLREGITVNALARRAARSDGHEFFLWDTSKGWRIRAGCRFFTFEEAWRHWHDTRGGTPLGDESLDILTFFSLHMGPAGGCAMRERLTLRPCERPAPAWLLDALASLARDAYDHPDYQERRAALLELAATEDRLRQLAQRAAYGSVLVDMAELAEDLIALVDGERIGGAADWQPEEPLPVDLDSDDMDLIRAKKAAYDAVLAAIKQAEGRA